MNTPCSRTFGPDAWRRSTSGVLSRVVRRLPAAGRQRRRTHCGTPLPRPLWSCRRRLSAQLEVLELIGQAAWARSSGAPAAARPLRLPQAAAPIARRRSRICEPLLARSAAFSRWLNHATIVAVYDHCSRRILLPAYEYVDGVNLARPCARAGVISPHHALASCRDLRGTAIRTRTKRACCIPHISPRTPPSMQGPREARRFRHRETQPLKPIPRSCTSETGDPSSPEPEPRFVRRNTWSRSSATPRATWITARILLTRRRPFYELLTGELPVGNFSPPSHSAADPRVDAILQQALQKESRAPSPHPHSGEMKTQWNSSPAPRPGWKVPSPRHRYPRRRIAFDSRSLFFSPASSLVILLIGALPLYL